MTISIPASKEDIEEIRELAIENRRTLRGNNGNPGLCTLVTVLQKSVDDLGKDLGSIRKGIWAVIFLILSLFVTTLYNIAMSPSVVEKVIITITATPHP